MRDFGFTIGTSAYDDEDRLTGVDVDNDSNDDVRYEYDAIGRRVQRDNGTKATVFVQNGQQTFADYTSGAAANSPTYNYLYASYINEPVCATAVVACGTSTATISTASPR